ncbi:B3 domain-containing transcription factor VRN1 [Linum grandiflorum]
MSCSGARSIGTRFFKIILHDTIRRQKLLIPGKFISKYGEGLANSAILKVPSGVKWVVGVVRDAIGVWFSNGWQQFAESNSLEYGHFLVFEYQGSSTFSVVICDRTATEIAYPICDNNKQPDDVRDKGKSPIIEVSPARKKMRGSVSVNDLSRMKMGTCNIQFPQRRQSGGQGLAGNVMKLALDDEEEEGTYDDKRMIYDEEVPSPQPMPEFSSQHPFFSIRITSKLLARKNLHVPVSFSAIHIGEDDKSVKLQMSDKTWSVALSRYRSKYVYFTGDWNVFIKENSLNPGDVCIFESVERMLLKVTIIRVDVN